MKRAQGPFEKAALSRRALLSAAGAALGAAAATGVSSRSGLAAVAGTATPRWGIAVDISRCASQSGCRACIDACHVAHKVPVMTDPRHEIKWVWKESFARVFPEQDHAWQTEARRQTSVLVLCNHCTNAPCTRVCPTQATWRRSDGVVAMDAHRCIGCRYCMTACPFGARSFNWENPKPAETASNYPARTAGVVEKCNMCVERLDAGQVPLCVETCQGRGAAALTFGNLEDATSSLRLLLASRQVLRRRPALGTLPSIFYLV
jgi:molybdopterin-containing oxidoreductase family iron-sulfur binding subunit